LTNEKDNYSLLEKRILKVGSIHTCDKLYLNTNTSSRNDQCITARESKVLYY